MARTPDIKIRVTLDPEPLKASLRDVLRALGFDAAAEALDSAPGVMTIPRSMGDTRDGREEIISQVGEAFDDPMVGCIIITDGPTSMDYLQAFGRAQGDE